MCCRHPFFFLFFFWQVVVLFIFISSLLFSYAAYFCPRFFSFCFLCILFHFCCFSFIVFCSFFPDVWRVFVAFFRWNLQRIVVSKAYISIIFVIIVLQWRVNGLPLMHDALFIGRLNVSTVGCGESAYWVLLFCVITLSLTVGLLLVGRRMFSLRGRHRF